MLPKNLWIVIGLATILRFYHLGVESAWFDELWAVDRAAGSVWEAIRSQSSRADPNFLYDFILHYWEIFIGKSEFEVRILSTLLSILTLYGLYRVGELMFNRQTGIIAALILSTSVFHIDFAQQARMYALVGCMSVFSYFYFLKILTVGTRKYYFAWVIVSALGFYTQFLCAFAILGQSVFLMIRYKSLSRRLVKNLVVSHFIVFICVIPCLIVVFCAAYSFGRPSSHYGLLDASTISDVAKVFVDFSGSYCMFTLFLGTLLAAIYLCVARRPGDAEIDDDSRTKASPLETRDALLLTCFWLVVPMILMLIVATSFAGLHAVWRPRYLSSFSFAFFLLCAYAYTQIHKKTLKNIVAILFVGFSVFSFVEHDRILTRQQIRQSAEYVQTHFTENQEIVIYPDYYRNMVTSQYLMWSTRQTKGLPAIRASSKQMDTVKFKEKVDETFVGGREIWVLYYVNHDDLNEESPLNIAVAETIDAVGGKWCVASEKAFESYLATSNIPYIGAYALLLKYCD